MNAPSGPATAVDSSWDLKIQVVGGAAMDKDPAIGCLVQELTIFPRRVTSVTRRSGMSMPLTSPASAIATGTIEREVDFGPAAEQQLTLDCVPFTPIEGRIAIESPAAGMLPRFLDLWEERSGRNIAIGADGTFSAKATRAQTVRVQAARN